MSAVACSSAGRFAPLGASKNGVRLAVLRAVVGRPASTNAPSAVSVMVTIVMFTALLRRMPVSTRIVTPSTIPAAKSGPSAVSLTRCN